MAQKYIIERRIAGDGDWVRSDSCPGQYTMDVAQGIILDRGACLSMHYRMTPVKANPYRRHAAVTYLELRGAQAMLTGARAYFCRAYTYEECREAYGLLYDAWQSVTRALEAL